MYGNLFAAAAMYATVADACTIPCMDFLEGGRKRDLRSRAADDLADHLHHFIHLDPRARKASSPFCSSSLVHSGFYYSTLCRQIQANTKASCFSEITIRSFDCRTSRLLTLRLPSDYLVHSKLSALLASFKFFFVCADCEVRFVSSQIAYTVRMTQITHLFPRALRGFRYSLTLASRSGRR